MLLDWTKYSGDSGTEDVPLLLSTRSQSLILAAMQSLEFRSNWLEVDDSTWDDIDAAVGEAYEEIMEIVVSATPKAISMYRNTSQAAISAASWGAIIPNLLVDDDGAVTLDTSTGIFTFNENGRVHLSLLAHLRNAATAQSLKQVRLYNLTDNFVFMTGSPALINASAIQRNWLGLQGVQNVSAGDEFQFQLKGTANSNTTVESDPDIDGLPSRSLQINMIWFPS